MVKRLSIVVALAAPLVVLACSEDAVPPTGTPDAPQMKARAQDAGVDPVTYFEDLMDEVNATLEAEGADYRAGMVEYLTASDEIGRTVFFRNIGNKQLAFDFVPFDPRRAPWSGPVSGPDDDIWYVVDQVDAVAPPGIGAAATTAAIDAAMGTWQAQRCSNIPLTKVPDLGLDLGFFAFLQSGGALGGPAILADIQHAGWEAPISPTNILGFTVTFSFVPAIDIDNNGKIDAAFREIYYNTLFNWAVDGVSNIDVETIALHEAGHGLSQAHFGKLFRTDKNGKFHFAQQAVMNAGYTGPQQTLLGSDHGGHCSNWGQWPNN